MEPRQILRSGITASAIVHLSFLLLLIVFSEVHPFSPVATEPIAVDLVTPEEAKEKTPEPPPPTPVPPNSDALDLSAKSAASSPAASDPATPNSPPSNSPPSNAKPSGAKPTTASTPQPAPTPAVTPQQPPSPPKQATSSLTAADRQLPATQPQASATPAPMMPATPPPAYVPAQPDLSIKYHVLLGLPQDNPGAGFDAVATQAADVGSSPIAEFRRHLKSCSTLPKSIAPTDKFTIKLRVRMAPDGKLADEPEFIEGPGSAKGPALMQSAIHALEACQPYTMMPADKYNEWKVLDLSFTPQDFTDAS